MRSHREDRELGAIVDRYVVPDRRYLNLLHGNFLSMNQPDRASFGRALAADARQVTDDELDRLLDYEWRAQLTAAWLAGFAHRTRLRERIGELLLASRRVYAGQGFCFALARFGTNQDARLLVEYLDRYLPQMDLRYDQPEGLGALLHLDGRLGTHEADRFLGAGGVWQRWAEPLPAMERDPEVHHSRISDSCSFADDCMRSQQEPDEPH